MPNQPFTLASFNTFGDLLKYLRRREHLTQLELSITVGYSEAQIGRLEKNQRRPDLTALKALFIPALHFEDEPELIARFLELAQSARQEDAPTPGFAPYKGLLFFDETDADLFFGREVLATHLTNRVADLASDASTRLLAVVGASGSGKSSLVRAGLVVALKRAGWEVRVFTPGADPLKALEMQLDVNQATAGSERVLILVDQFEEVFTLCRDESERVHFIEKLLELATLTPSPLSLRERGWGEGITVVIALRADFYSHCAQYPLLRNAVAAQQEYIGQMSAEELRRAIEEPAKRGGWDFEPGLVDLLLQDIGVHGASEPEPGALPLLSHALLATWELRRGRTFTLDGYRAIGGVRGAIAETAESVFTDQLNQQQQDLAREVFLRLTELGEGTEDTRRRAGLNELVRQSAEATQLRTVLNTLAEARLITLNEDSAEVAHEALIREWQRLHEWLTDDRDGLRLHRHLTDATHEWEARGHDPAEVYRGARLAQAREWAQSNLETLNDSERVFLQVSIEREDRDAMEREAQRLRELDSARKLFEAQKQAAGRLRRVSAFLFASLMIATFLAWSTYRVNRLATSRELTSASVSNLEVDPERSILLALQALSISETREAEDALHRAIIASRMTRRIKMDAEMVSVAYSPDGKRVVSAGQDGIATVWDVSTGKLLLELKGHSEQINQVRFSPNGKLIATASDDSTVWIWDATTGDMLFMLKGHTARVCGLAFSPDGTRIVTVSDDTSLRMWNVVDGSLIFVGPERTNDRAKMTAVAFSPDGKLIATGSGERRIEIWNGETYEIIDTISSPDANVIASLAFSPDNKSLASASTRNVRLWDVSTGQNTLEFTEHTNVVYSVTFSPDGNRIASAGLDRKIHIWDVRTGQIVITLAGHEGAVNAASFSPDGSRLASVSDDATLRIWDVGPARELFAVDTFDPWPHLALSQDGRWIAEGVGTSIKVWDAHTLEELFSLPEIELVNGVAFSPDAKQIASASDDGKVRIWDLQSHTVVSALDAQTPIVTTVAYSPDGKLLASVGEDNVVRIWDVETEEMLFELGGQPGAVISNISVAFSPDSSVLATGGIGGDAFLWNTRNGERIRTLEGHTDTVWGVAFNGDGERLVTASRDSTAKVWDTKTGALLLTLNGHTSTVQLAAFSPDGMRIATAGRDGKAIVWDAVTGKILLTFPGDGSAVGDAEFTHDGIRLITASDESLRVYAINLSDLIALANTRLTRGLTQEECQKYLYVTTCPAMP